MNRDLLLEEYKNLYRMYVDLQDDVIGLKNAVYEVEWQWENLCKKNGIKIIK